MVIRQTFDRPLVLADAFAGYRWRGLDWRSNDKSPSVYQNQVTYYGLIGN